MGKKKITTQSAEQAIKETKTQETAATKSGSVQVSAKKFERGKVFINASFNNTLMTIADEKGNVIAWSSAGALGFSGPKKATPFASTKVVATIAEKIKKSGPFNVEVYVNGVGSGRDSAVRSLANHGFNILSIKDVTPIPHNGPRPAKVRRV